MLLTYYLLVVLTYLTTGHSSLIKDITYLVAYLVNKTYLRTYLFIYLLKRVLAYLVT